MKKNDTDNKVSLWQSFEKLGDIYMQDSKYEKATSMYKNAHHVQANGDVSFYNDIIIKLVFFIKLFSNYFS